MRAETTGELHRHSSSRLRIRVVLVVIASVGLAISVAFIVPVGRPHSTPASVQVQLPSQGHPECTATAFSHSGTYSFSLQIYTGDPTYLNVSESPGSLIYSELSNSH